MESFSELDDTQIGTVDSGSFSELDDTRNGTVDSGSFSDPLGAAHSCQNLEMEMRNEKTEMEIRNEKSEMEIRKQENYVKPFLSSHLIFGPRNVPNV